MYRNFISASFVILYRRRPGYALKPILSFKLHCHSDQFTSVSHHLQSWCCAELEKPWAVSVLFLRVMQQVSLLRGTWLRLYLVVAMHASPVLPRAKELQRI